MKFKAAISRPPFQGRQAVMAGLPAATSAYQSSTNFKPATKPANPCLAGEKRSDVNFDPMLPAGD
ncbi:MAG TPA: hypothetical protein VKD90_25015 [Gemmataceae bacterium]|nr:hypothetical protein [Gemmataceae bacterium]